MGSLFVESSATHVCMLYLARNIVRNAVNADLSGCGVCLYSPCGEGYLWEKEEEIVYIGEAVDEEEVEEIERNNKM